MWLQPTESWLKQWVDDNGYLQIAVALKATSVIENGADDSKASLSWIPEWNRSTPLSSSIGTDTK